MDTIRNEDERCATGWDVPNMIMLGLFKEVMNEETRMTFKKQGWTIIDLQRNPYLYK